MEKLLESLNKLREERDNQVGEQSINLTIIEEELKDIEHMIENPTKEEAEKIINHTTDGELYDLLCDTFKLPHVPSKADNNIELLIQFIDSTRTEIGRFLKDEITSAEAVVNVAHKAQDLLPAKENE